MCGKGDRKTSKGEVSLKFFLFIFFCASLPFIELHATILSPIEKLALISEFKLRAQRLISKLDQYNPDDLDSLKLQVLIESTEIEISDEHLILVIEDKVAFKDAINFFPDERKIILDGRRWASFFQRQLDTDTLIYHEYAPGINLFGNDKKFISARRKKFGSNENVSYNKDVNGIFTSETQASNYDLCVPQVQILGEPNTVAITYTNRTSIFCTRSLEAATIYTCSGPHLKGCRRNTKFGGEELTFTTRDNFYIKRTDAVFAGNSPIAYFSRLIDFIPPQVDLFEGSNANWNHKFGGDKQRSCEDAYLRAKQDATQICEAYLIAHKLSKESRCEERDSDIFIDIENACSRNVMMKIVNPI